MANILLTQKCNQACPYCFASYEAGRESISLENFLTAVDFISRTPGAKIGLLGGEPLLHPEFGVFCEALRENPKVGAVVVYTNGRLLHRHLEELSREKFALLINLNEKSFYTGDDFDRLRDNIRAAVDRLSTDNVLLGLNVYRQGMEIDAHLSLLRELKMRKLRLSLAIPAGGAGLSHREQYEQMRGELFRIFKALADADVLPQFDCNRVPLCYYSPEELSLLKGLFGQRLQETNLLSAETACKPVLDIYPDLTVCRCFGRTDLRVKLLDFRNIRDLSRFFANRMDNRRFDGPHERCRTCYLNRTMNCMGGCMAYDAEGEDA